jgi:hypothetical protein
MDFFLTFPEFECGKNTVTRYLLFPLRKRGNHSLAIDFRKFLTSQLTSEKRHGFFLTFSEFECGKNTVTRYLLFPLGKRGKSQFGH